MKAKDFVQFASKMIVSGLPFCVEAEPGVGKTELCKVAAKLAEKELGKIDLIISHPTVRSPIDYGGIPAKVREATAKSDAVWNFVPIGDLWKLVNAKKPTVCFIDDIGHATPAVQAALMQLILARQIGENMVSDHVRFIAATNRAQDKAGVHPMLEPVKSRFTTIVHLDPDVESWVEWAATCEDVGLLNVQEAMPAVVTAYIAWKGHSALFAFQPKPGLENTPVPRTVHHVGQMLAAGAITESTAFEVITGAVGKGWAIEFLSFLKTWAQLPDAEEVIDDPDILDALQFDHYVWDEQRGEVVSKGHTSISGRPDIGMAIVTKVAEIVKPSQMDGFVRLLSKFTKPVEVLGMLLLRQRDSKFQETPAFIRWASQNNSYIM